MLSALQHAWDQYFESSQCIVVICGSQVRTMELLLGRQSPIYGRLTGQWLLRPLPFGTLRAFFPAWSPAEQVAAYAVVGGVPTYLRWLDPAQTLTENIRRLIRTPGGMALYEVELLLADEVREPRTYLAILRNRAALAMLQFGLCAMRSQVAAASSAETVVRHSSHGRNCSQLVSETTARTYQESKR